MFLLYFHLTEKQVQKDVKDVVTDSSTSLSEWGLAKAKNDHSEQTGSRRCHYLKTSGLG